MGDLLTEIAIVVMYLGTMMGMVLFLAFVCRVGDLGIMLFGWLDRKIQEMPKKAEATAEKYPFAYGPPGAGKSSSF